MKKTSVYLDPWLDRALASLAGERGVTKAELIRQALADAVNGARPRLALIGIIDDPDGPTDVSTNTDHYLEGLGED